MNEEVIKQLREEQKQFLDQDKDMIVWARGCGKSQLTISRIIMYWAYERVCDYYSTHDVEITLGFAHETIKRLALEVWKKVWKNFYGKGKEYNADSIIRTSSEEEV